MGYQALLFCPDEKLARVVSQVFGEVEFTVDPVSEPFVAVKKMMAQRYDAIAVDCTDEQNASLLFKSARNSSVNQGSLAIAVVEGQAGVAKAYRIGANLVLTKPINVEQSKGTLRVARGLLRKNFDAATGASHAVPAVASQAAPAESATSASTPAGWPVSASRTAEPPLAFAASRTEPPAVEAPTPAMAASAKSDEKPAIPAPDAETRTPIVAQAAAESAPLGVKPVIHEPAKTEASKTIVEPAPAAKTAPVSQGAAAAPALAKEVTAPSSKEVKPKTEADGGKKERAVQITPAVQPQTVPPASAPRLPDGPAFAALGVEHAGASGRSKKLFFAVLTVLALAAAGYYGWTKFGAAHLGSAPPPAALSPQKTAPQVPTVSVPAQPLSVAPARASGATAVTSKPSAIQTESQPAGASTADRKAPNAEPETKKPASSPIQVKPATAKVKGQTQSEEPSSELPSPLAVASAGDTGLGGLVTSPASGAQPVLARLKVSQGVSQGLLIKRVQPRYPANAVASGAQGAVQIEATIDKEGKVVNPKVLSGDRMLAAAAIDAVRQWRYKPYYLNGQPVEIQTQITINFKLN